MMNYISDKAKEALEKAPIFTRKDFEEPKLVKDDKNEFTCLATKLDEYIRRVDEKTFRSIFKYSCDLKRKKQKHIYDIVDWKLKIKDEL